MCKNILFAGIFLLASQLSGQVLVINELDSDTPGIDDKEFVELRSETPHFPLDGYVLVFFNGSTSGGNSSYLALDLDGYITDVNGLLLIGSEALIPFPQYLIEPNLIQNGPDAVAIYRRNAEEFPEGTVAFVDSTLIDVLLYDTNDPDVLSMIAIFQVFRPGILQISEGAGNNSTSIQRNNNGTYFVGPPTPRRLNDGSGIVLNGLRTVPDKSRYTEGDTMRLTFMTEQALTEALTIRFSLSNGGFKAADFTGDTVFTISGGSNAAIVPLVLIDDALDEGDEVLQIRIPELPAGFFVLNNNISIRIVDNDYRVASFGTPLQPTYGKVGSTQPPGYYDRLAGKGGAALKGALQQLIADPEVVRAQTYADVIDIVKEADQNPAHSNEVWLVYLERGMPKLDFQTTGNNLGVWNREHTWPRSRGGFFSIEADTLADGRDIYWPTNADSLRHANSDAHAIRAVDARENVTRSNQFYGQYTGPAGNLGSFKGDVARGVFYLAIRYNGLSLVNGYPEGLTGQYGDLATLLEWHRSDPPDDYEMNRNNVVYSWQFNRNPFIDLPDLAEYFWGNRAGEVWQPTRLRSAPEPLVFDVYPNPASGKLYLTGLSEPAEAEICDLQGRVLFRRRIAPQDSGLDLRLPAGIYLIRIAANGKTGTKKIVIE